MFIKYAVLAMLTNAEFFLFYIGLSLLIILMLL